MAGRDVLPRCILFVSAYLLREARPLCAKLVTFSGLSHPKGNRLANPSELARLWMGRPEANLFLGVCGGGAAPEKKSFEVGASRTGTIKCISSCTSNDKIIGDQTPDCRCGPPPQPLPFPLSHPLSSPPLFAALRYFFSFGRLLELGRVLKALPPGPRMLFCLSSLPQQHHLLLTCMG